MPACAGTNGVETGSYPFPKASNYPSYPQTRDAGDLAGSVAGTFSQKATDARATPVLGLQHCERFKHTSESPLMTPRFGHTIRPHRCRQAGDPAGRPGNDPPGLGDKERWTPKAV